MLTNIVRRVDNGGIYMREDTNLVEYITCHNFLKISLEVMFSSLFLCQKLCMLDRFDSILGFKAWFAIFASREVALYDVYTVLVYATNFQVSL
jgi:hypothetical protein